MTSTILIADRNPYIRKFLQRELINAGFEVLLAENARQVLLLVDRHPSLVLIILDPDLPDKDMISILDDIRLHGPFLPVVVHGHPNGETENNYGAGIWFVEKRGNSIEVIIRMVREILNYGL
jgi:DNA-binding response OmpR family regulator